MGTTKTMMAALVFALGVYAVQTLCFAPRVNLPPHMLGHPPIYVDEMLTPEIQDALWDEFKGMKTFPMNTRDTQFYTTEHEHIGEAEEIGADKTCDNPYLVPNVNRSACILPGRIDIGRHFILGGGVHGIKESYDRMISRILSFGRYIFAPDKDMVVGKLFASPSFVDSAKAICPPDAQVLDPFQYNVIWSVPGQGVATHIDGVYFWGATRFNYPQWLLAVMKGSGLFEELFISQVQVVAYVHKWKDERGGDFVWWDTPGQQEPHSIKPKGGAGSAVDGSQTVHAASIYRPDVDPPLMDKSKDNVLTYHGNDKWSITETESGTVLREYTTDDLRVSIVYRARCFASEEDKARFNAGVPAIPLDDILAILTDDLVQKGKLAPNQDISRYDLAMKLLDAYIPYPLSTSAWFPYNYCALTRLIPASNHLLKYVC